MLDYDPDYQIVFSAEERDMYKNQLNWDDARIDLEQNKRTEEFHDLHNRYSVLGDTYNPDWTYDLIRQNGMPDTKNLGYEPEFDPTSAVDSVNDTIAIGPHLFTTGTGVVYNVNGGTGSKA